MEAPAAQPAFLPVPVDCCDICFASPIQTPTVYRCTVCRTWACCDACHSWSLLPLPQRAEAAADKDWSSSPDGPCALCGSSFSALWRQGPAGSSPLCAGCCALGAAESVMLSTLEEHDAEHRLVASPVAPSVAADPPTSGPLAAVVSAAAQRWHCDTLRLAKQGDGAAMEALGWQLHEGYGCVRDEAVSRWWRGAARDNGARRTVGVYDSLP